MIDTIVYTGSTGSIGADMPQGGHPLQTRLEESVEARVAELQGFSLNQWGFIHLAGLISVQECERDPERARSLNVEGAKKWFQAACQQGCRHFVHVSTSHVYGPGAVDQLLTVDAEINPGSIYSKTKWEAEEELRKLSTQYPDTRLTIARVFSVLSNTMRPGFLLTALHQRAQNRDFSPIPNLKNVRDFLTSPVICQRLTQLARRVDTPGIVQICSGKGKSVEQIARQVFEEYGLDPNLICEAPETLKEPPNYLIGLPDTF